MRHLVFGRKLGRDIKARQALLRNLASSIMLSGYVVTTETKAKFAKSYIEKLIRNSQKNSLALKRTAASTLSEKAFQRLINEIGPGFGERNGGYTRIIKVKPRKGDGATLARLELLHWDTSKTKVVTKTPKPKKVVAKKVAPAKVVKETSKKK